MANTQVTTRDTQLEDQRIGRLELTLTNFANESEPAIAAGSVVEVGGSLYVFTSDESISGWSGISNDTECYIRLVPGASSVTAEFTTTAPTWSDALQGFYNGSNRYIGGCRRGASSAVYQLKWVFQRSQSNNNTHRFYGNGSALFDETIRVGHGLTPNVRYASNVPGTITENQIFDALAPYIPDNGDSITMNGALVNPSGVVMILNVATRNSSTNIGIYGLGFTPGSAGITTMAFSIDDGGADVYSRQMWW